MSLPSIFVFGSDLGGSHRLGSAAEAVRHHGAEVGVGRGPTGRAYAIPTKDADLLPLTIHEIHQNVMRFIIYAERRPELRFHVVKVGCGLAGYMEEEIKPFFEKAPENCILPEGWR